MRSGVSNDFAQPFWVWISTVFHCATDRMPCRLAISIIGGWPGNSAASSWRTPGSLSISACFWKNSSPAMPEGARTSETGRPFRCVIIRSPTRSK